VQGSGGLRQRDAAPVQVEVVVAVASVVAAAGGGDQSAVSQLTQVVGEQVLRLVEQRHQIADPKVALGECREQLPAQWVGGQPDERRRGEGLTGGSHDCNIHQTGLMD
jgi:hypothetical protein